MGTEQNDQLEEYNRIRADEVRKLLGGISVNCLYKWIRDPDLQFPQPIMMGKLRTWTAAEILEWIKERPWEDSNP